MITDVITARDAYFLARTQDGQDRPADLDLSRFETDLGRQAAAALQRNGTGPRAALADFLTTVPKSTADGITSALIAVDTMAPPPATSLQPDPSDDRLQVACPELPASARHDAVLAADACPWLDSYVNFSRKWSPRGYDGFHEACGLFVLSTVAARRVALAVGKTRYTPLSVLLCGRSSMFAKTTTAEIALDVLRTAGFDYLLAADEATPQRFIRDLTLYVPPDYDDLPLLEQERILKRLAFAGQRGWFFEEFGQHLDAMMREGGTMSEFRGLLRRFDDCALRYEYSTLGRGSDVIDRPYLALLANVTPADLRALARRGAPLWTDGFWARFAFVAPAQLERSLARFPDGERVIPKNLVEALQAWHEGLGVPPVHLVDGEDERGKARKRAVVDTPRLKLASADKAVIEAYYHYYDALLDLAAHSELDDLDGNYARFAEKALRIALLLASIANQGHVELRHWARAQAIAERWRAGLHAAFGQVNEDEPSVARQMEDKLKAVVGRLAGKGPLPTAADAARYVRGLASGDAQKYLDGLVRAGDLEAVRSERATRYHPPSPPETAA